MPKKTRQQKIKAQKRRVSPVLQPQQSKPQAQTPANPGLSYSFAPLPKTGVTQNVHAIDPGQLTIIKRDLAKTVILTVICCGIVIGLSFVWK